MTRDERAAGVERVALCVLVSLAAWSCSAEGSSSSSRRGGAVGAGAAGGQADGASAGPRSDDPFGNSTGTAPPTPDVPVSSQGDSSGDACPSIGRTAIPDLGPADVVWIIDGSGSMIDEAERLQQNLDSFTSTIAAAGVDTRVVLLAQLDLVPPGSGLAQSGNYLFVPATVDSHNALDVLVAQYDAYASFLRPDAHVHFIVVTDDESEYMALGTPQDRADAFKGAMDGLLSNEYTVHTVSSPGQVGDPPCIPEKVTQEVLDCCLACFFLCFDAPPAGCEHLVDANGVALINPLSCAFLGGAARPGVTYYTLADMTSGVAASICAEDWTNVFAALSQAVIESTPLPCNYPIPEPPPGMFFERDKVNVRFTPTGENPGDVAPFPAVGTPAACGDDAAWYFDKPDAPTEILLCPASCDAVGSNRGGEMQIVFGCDTVILE